MNPSLKFSRSVSAQLIKWVLKTSWNSPVVWRNFSCDLRETRCGGAEKKWREKLHGETRFMTFNGKSIFVLQWKTFSIFFQENDSGTEGENAMRYTENNPHYYYDFLPQSTLGRTKEIFWMHLMVKRWWKFAWDSWPSWGWFGNDVGEKTLNTDPSAVTNPCFRINSNLKKCQSNEIFCIILESRQVELFKRPCQAYSTCKLPNDALYVRKTSKLIPKYHCTSLSHQPLLKNVRLALKLYCFWGTVCQSHASKVFQIWKAPHRNQILRINCTHHKTLSRKIFGPFRRWSIIGLLFFQKKFSWSFLVESFVCVHFWANNFSVLLVGDFFISGFSMVFWERTRDWESISKIEF